MSHFKWLKAMSVVLLATLLCACNVQFGESPESEKAEKEEKDERVPVEVEALGRGSIEAVVLSSANLEAEESVKVYSRTTNQVVELLVEEGDRVEAGQLLVRLEDDTHKLQLSKAEARLSKAERDYKRTEDLFQKEFVAQQEMNNATFELQQAKVDFEEAKRELSYTKITAPITGTITSRLVKFGDFVNNGLHLFDIVDFNSIVARVYLPEKNLAELDVGQAARLTSQALGGDHFDGKIKRIAPLVDARTGTVKVTVAVDNRDRLMPGMYVDVAIVLEVRNQALLIPKRALIYDNDQVFAFRLDRSGERIVAERVLVKPALTDETRVMPSGDFEEGDEIVVAGQTGLKDRAAVRVLGEDDPEADRWNKKEDKEAEATAGGNDSAEGDVALND